MARWYGGLWVCLEVWQLVEQVLGNLGVGVK